MAFRPQFAYHVPPGWKEESCEFLWNNQYPAMSLPQAVPGAPVYNLLLQMDDSSDVWIRSLYWFGEGLSGSGGGLAIRLKDAFGRYLSMNPDGAGNLGGQFGWVNLANYGMGFTLPNPFTPPTNPTYPYTGGMGCVFQPEIYAPMASVLSMDICSLSELGTDTPAIAPTILLRGMRRVKLGACA
jgi:hypothetical protein